MRLQHLERAATVAGGSLQKTVGEMALGATDTAGGWIGKVRWIEHGVVVRALREQALSSGTGFRGILVGEEREVRPHELDRVVHNVAHEHRPRAAALSVHQYAAGRVTRCVLEPDAVLDLAMH